MPDYRRADVPRGTYFFTLVTERREPFLCTDRARTLRRESIDACRAGRPFDAEAFVLPARRPRVSRPCGVQSSL